MRISQTRDLESRVRLVAGHTVELPPELAERLDEQAARFNEGMTESLMAASVAIGLEELGDLMDAEVSKLAGSKGRHDPARSHNPPRDGARPGHSGGPAGSDPPAPGPGRGGAGAEATLEAYQAARATDLLAELMVGPCWRDSSPVATRPPWSRSGRRRSVGREAPPPLLGVTAIRACHRRAAGELQVGRLDRERFLVVVVDGFSFADHQLVGAGGDRGRDQGAAGGLRGDQRETIPSAPGWWPIWRASMSPEGAVRGGQLQGPHPSHRR